MLWNVLVASLPTRQIDGTSAREYFSLKYFIPDVLRIFPDMGINLSRTNISIGYRQLLKLVKNSGCQIIMDLSHLIFVDTLQSSF